MSESGTRSLLERTRHVIAERPVMVLIASALVFVGFFPGPALLLMRDPAWRTDVAVRHLTDQRAFWIAGALLIIGPAVVLANTLSERSDRGWSWLRGRLMRISDAWFLAGIILFAMSAAAAAAIYVFSRKPTTSDEVAQLWQARILLTGRLWLPVDPNPEFFAVDNMIDQTRWYSQFPIGGPAILALAMWLQATWLMNPLLTGLSAVNVYRFASRAYGRAEARVAAALLALSPFLLMMGGSYMNHMIVVFLTSLALAELPVAIEDVNGRRRIVGAIVIGLSLGLAVAVRPLDGVVAVLALGGTFVLIALRRRQIREVVVAALVGAVPIAGLLVTNWLTTGHPLLFGYEVLWGANHALGFHPDPSGNLHTPARAAALATLYLLQLNWSLFEWPIAGLLIVSIALIAIGRLGRWEALLLVWIAGQLTAYALYWHAGTFLGPRYLLTVVPAFLLIVARGFVIATRSQSPAWRRSVVVVVVASVLSAWTIPFTPVGAFGAATAARPLREALKVDLDPAVSSLRGDKALIFVGEPVSNRLLRRMWGLGISRPDAARLVATKDNCALLDIALDEAQRVDASAQRLARFELAKAYAAPPGMRFRVADVAFRTNDESSITPRCRKELQADIERRRAVLYGPTLLLNDIGADGRIAGPIVFVADLAEHNEVLRSRFGDRPWYRLTFVGTAPDGPFELVPYR